jgi:hypothetical protein
MALSDIARLPDVGEAIVAEMADDRRTDFDRHVDAKMRIQAGYPRMIEMLGSLP